MNPTAFHSSTSWPGSSEPHVVPKQDQPTSSEPEIDLEALMELSTEEQKTQLEVELGTKGNPRTQVLLPHPVWGEPVQRGKFLGDWGLVKKCCGSGTHSAFFHQALLQNCPRPTEVRDALVVWAKRGPSGPAASEEEGLALGPSPLS